MLDNFTNFIQNQTIRLVSYLVIIFTMLMLATGLVANLTVNNKLNQIINKISLVRKNFIDFKLHYSANFLPTSELKGMILILEDFKISVEGINILSENLSLREKISIQSLSTLYLQKTNSLLKIASDFYKISNLPKIEIADSTIINNLIEVEKQKLNYLDNSTSAEFFKNRIDTLRDINYNLSSSIFKENAKKQLELYLKYFSTIFLNSNNSIEKAIEQKKSEILT
jgi:hypothetical protein